MDYQIKPLEWSGFNCNAGVSLYASTPWGDYQVQPSIRPGESYKWLSPYEPGNEAIHRWHEAESLEAAKAAAELSWQNAVSSVMVPE